MGLVTGTDSIIVIETAKVPIKIILILIIGVRAVGGKGSG